MSSGTGQGAMKTIPAGRLVWPSGIWRAFGPVEDETIPCANTAFPSRPAHSHLVGGRDTCCM
jgi:hypothetical protein